jgi:hypothetical protein
MTPCSNPYAVFRFLRLQGGATARLCTFSTLLLLGAPSAQAQSAYQQDMAACRQAGSGQSMADCRREAGAVQQQRRQSPGRRLPTWDATTYERNALARCAAHEGQARTNCEARMRSGTVQGSVAAGGLLRSLEVEVETPAR